NEAEGNGSCGKVPTTRPTRRPAAWADAEVSRTPEGLASRPYASKPSAASGRRCLPSPVPRSSTRLTPRCLRRGTDASTFSSGRLHGDCSPLAASSRQARSHARCAEVRPCPTGSKSSLMRPFWEMRNPNLRGHDKAAAGWLVTFSHPDTMTFINLGCRTNAAETDEIAALLSEAQNFVVVNSCTVTTAADRARVDDHEVLRL